MRSQSGIGGAHVLLALVACATLCCRVSGHPVEPPADEITLESEQIFVKFDDGPTFSLMVELDGKLSELRNDIYEHEGAAPELSIHNDDKRNDNNEKKIPDHEIRAGSSLTLVTAEAIADRVAKFNVRTREGRTLQVVTRRGNSVSDLKNNITQWTGIPQVEQRLLLRGKELKDERKLAHYYVKDGETIDLGEPLEACRHAARLYVKTLSDATIELEVDLADTVDGLKERIHKKSGIPAVAQRLFANERAIIGDDHLCDLGLEAGSVVYMILHSRRITSLDQVARLRDSHVARPAAPEEAPIFREVEDAGEQVSDGAVSLLKDARNWLTPGDKRPAWDAKLFDPIAHLSPNPDCDDWIREVRGNLERYSSRNASESDRLEAVMSSARLKLSLAIRPYRVAANLTSKNNDRESPGITLGGGSIEVNPGQPIPLGADVNNWAPDAFSDADVVRLFEVSERVRQSLARAAQTGEGILSIASQSRINRAILSTYLEALAGSPSALPACDRTLLDEECRICRDDLAAEPAIKLPCEHMFHADCILSWVVKLYQTGSAPRCPFCRHRFMFPYDAQGKAELETLELRAE